MKNNKILIIILCLCIFGGLAGYFLKNLPVNRTPAAQTAENVPGEEGSDVDYQFNIPDQGEYESNAIDSGVYDEQIKLYKCAQIMYVTEETIYNRDVKDYTRNEYTRYYDSIWMR